MEGRKRDKKQSISIGNEKRKRRMEKLERIKRK